MDEDKDRPKKEHTLVDGRRSSRFLETCVLARWRHHAQVCQCPGSKKSLTFRSAPFASHLYFYYSFSLVISFFLFFLFFFFVFQKTELEISDSAFAAIPKYAPCVTKTQRCGETFRSSEARGEDRQTSDRKIRGKIRAREINHSCCCSTNARCNAWSLRQFRFSLYREMKRDRKKKERKKKDR